MRTDCYRIGEKALTPIKPADFGVRRCERDAGGRPPETRLPPASHRGQNRCASSQVACGTDVVTSTQPHSILRCRVETPRKSSQHSCRCAAARIRVAQPECDDRVSRLAELCRQGQFEAAQKELDAENAVSIEPEAMPDFPKE